MSLHADVVVIGGGLGGVAAAIAALTLGRSVVLVAETDWLGGQLTSQLIPLDEHPWIETTGRNASYADLRHRIREAYRRTFPLTAAARRTVALNPGQGNIGPLVAEPHVAAVVLDELMAPWISSGRLSIIRGAEIVGADTLVDEVTAVHVARPGGDTVELRGRLFLDATDLGDLLEHAGVEHVIGAEGRADTGELHAVNGPADPRDQQAFTWAMVLGYDPDGDHTITRPEQYDRWQQYRAPFWPGSLLSFDVSDHVTHRPRARPLFLEGERRGTGAYDLWHARRIRSAEVFEPGWTSDATVAAWPMQDYWIEPLLGVDEQTRAQALEGARQLSLSFLYWMQTAAPRHDGGTGYPGLHLLPDVAGTDDGLAQRPYIREGRRIVPEFRILEQHGGVAARPGTRGSEPFADSVGVGAYRIDLHPTPSGRNTVDIDTWPFQIPLGALIPVRVENVLPAAKNIGTTHITNGAYRLHPVEWGIGEAAGALAAFALAEGVTPRRVHGDIALRERFQRLLSTELGVQLAWPRFDEMTPTRRWGYVPQNESDRPRSVPEGV